MAASEQFRLPDLKTTLKVSSGALWDVKFYPYHDVGENQPLFAIVSSGCLHVCQIDETAEYAMVILLSVRLDAAGSNPLTDSLNSCTWCYIRKDQPLIAVAGDNGQVNVISALSGQVAMTLLGHGIGTVNDLSTHPLYPWIIASASMDASARIWDLRRADDPHESTCVVICGHGQAHEEGLLTVSWHNRGRYLITGGHDQKICVWTLPDLGPSSAFWASISRAERQRSADEVYIVHFPHFISSAVHNNYVDKAVFFGDLVLSKAAEENKVVLWKITGFNSRHEIPSSRSAPKTNEFLDTRNGFIRQDAARKEGAMVHLTDEKYQKMPPYQRLLEFEAPRCKWFYMRFGFLQPSASHPHLHPTLAMGNLTSDIFFWDFENLLLGRDGNVAKSNSEAINTNSMRKQIKPKKGTTTRVSRMEQLSRSNHGQSPSTTETSASPARSASVTTVSTSRVREPSAETTSHTSEIRSSIENPSHDRARYALDNPHKPLKAHKTVKKGFDWTARAADWSTCGRWCIVVGDADGVGVAALTRRSGRKQREVG